ncbi:MAG: 7-carboxy-7-deazaguanine synthase QueE [Verrucomicrobiales bacterium]
MRISEIFYSIQGEGELTGVPSVFVRTSGCNLRCRWCDTKYASWNPEGENMEIGEIVGRVLESEFARHVVITGGEPMVAKGIHDLCQALKDEDFHITIETAATVAPDGLACDLASLSPKLRNSTPLPGEIEDSWIEKHEPVRLQPDVIRDWIDNYHAQLKFVVADPDGFSEIAELLDEVAVPIRRHQILLMPEGTTSDALESRRMDIIDLCKEHGFRYCPRLHIDLFGNKRGT